MNIFFGVDWLTETELEIFSSLNFGDSISISSLKNGMFMNAGEARNFRDAVKIESAIVTENKLIYFGNDIYIYISDDRDIFYIAAPANFLFKILSCFQNHGLNTFTQSVISGKLSPKKEVKLFFDHWDAYNFEKMT